jgi:hypothetical protein
VIVIEVVVVVVEVVECVCRVEVCRWVGGWVGWWVDGRFDVYLVCLSRCDECHLYIKGKKSCSSSWNSREEERDKRLRLRSSIRHQGNNT